MMISDIILLQELPDFVKNSVDGHIACLSGAIRKQDYISAIAAARFKNISIDKQSNFPLELMLMDPIAQKIIFDNNLNEKDIKAITDSIASISISANKE
jgi:arsenite methyltransferase